MERHRSGLRGKNVGDDDEDFMFSMFRAEFAMTYLIFS